jgi:hypothetical protein
MSFENLRFAKIWNWVYGYEYKVNFPTFARTNVKKYDRKKFILRLIIDCKHTGMENSVMFLLTYQ